MKKFLLPLMVILLFSACKKEHTITICHYEVATGTSQTIGVSQSALDGHLKHGDLLGDCMEVLTTTICDQDWMVKNLAVTTYRNGDPIPEVTDPTTWSALTTGAWCYFANTAANGTIYGKLYNWYAVNDPRGLAPTGWHVPSDAEWITLEDCLGGWQVAGGKMKSTGTIEAGTGLWRDPNTGGTNSSGFTGLPGGIRSGDIALDFPGLNGAVYWWSSTEFSADRAWTRQAFFKGSYLQSCHEQVLQQPCFTKEMGLSVRCVRD